MLTAEEKWLRIKESKRLRREHIANFPQAELGFFGEEEGLSIKLKEGDDSYLIVAHRGKFAFQNSRFPEWQESWIHLDDPFALAKFMRALTARYNAMVDQINKQAEQATLKVLKPIREEGEAGEKPPGFATAGNEPE